VEVNAVKQLPTDYRSVMAALAPYYHLKRPLDFFFEMYIVDVLELLPAEASRALDEFSAKHPTFFAKHGGDWRTYVVHELHLSETIEVAIWDLWLKNSQALKGQGLDYHPRDYAQDFHKHYTADGSRVDVWEGNALAIAKQRIHEYRTLRKPH
jgi:hypothetical protein